MRYQKEIDRLKRRTGVDNTAHIDNKARHPWARKCPR
jgi:hypothetical protein